MKLTVCLGAPLFALLALPAGVRAAPPDPSANPYAGVDPDGVPLAVTQELNKPSSDQAAAKQAADEDMRARNWLLLDYQQQLQRNKAESSPNGQALNLYLQLSMNRDYKPNTDDATAAQSQPVPSLRAMPSPIGPNNHGMNLRADPTARAGFTPLISPLSSPGVLSATQPFNASAYTSPLPPSLVPGSEFGAPSTPAQAPAPAPNRTPPSPTDTVDMQTPGMVADKTAPLPGVPDLNLDSLPDQSSTNPQPRDAPPILAQPGQPMDANQLHAVIDAKLNSPKVTLNPAANQQKQLEPPKPAPPPPPETPSPISQQPVISPVHAPLPSPFDILNR